MQYFPSQEALIAENCKLRADLKMFRKYSWYSSIAVFVLLISHAFRSAV